MSKMILLIIRFYSNKGQLNLSVNEINSIVDISKTYSIVNISLFQGLVYCHRVAKSL